VTLLISDIVNLGLYSLR